MRSGHCVPSAAVFPARNRGSAQCVVDLPLPPAAPESTGHRPTPRVRQEKELKGGTTPTGNKTFLLNIRVICEVIFNNNQKTTVEFTTRSETKFKPPHQK